jgi:cytochrome c oxidase assembly protein subunit 15
MFLYPWSEMVGNIFYEHSHRLVASAVGFLTILLALSLWLGETRKWLRWLGAAALVLVVLQGVIGGLRVVLLEHTLAILHACLAHAFFALVVSLALFTSNEWSSPAQSLRHPHARQFRSLCVLTASLIYAQAISGAVLRHAGSRFDVHLVLAFLVAVHVLLLTTKAWRFYRSERPIHQVATFLSALSILQIALGLASYFSRFTSVGVAWPQPVVVGLTTSHVVTGALLLVTSLVLALRSFRVPEPADSPKQVELLSEEMSA